ncbi:MAG: HD domain-containing protein [ANME-2 cluster archaeon]|nr:HD domain-containing protein [ANME-2 cluster archaeon]MDF1532375.1 HD domain-containing protein [ANME-2 cluster archaeon]
MQPGSTVHDPLHGHVHINQLEAMLISTREMQRLRRVQQLGLADIAFPGANHTRYEHSIGTMHVANMMGHALELEEMDIRKVRIAALLHDVGHSAFSHSVESVLARNPDFMPLIGGERFSSHEMFTSYIIRNNFPGYDTIANEVTSVFGVDASEFFSEISAMATGNIEGCQKPYLAQIISGDIDADRIDFLVRDSYHTGVSLGLIDVEQIVDSLTLKDGRVVLGGHDSYSEDMALAAAESILIARSHHYSAIIHNPVTQSVRAMLLRALEDTLDTMEDKHEVMLAITEFFTIFNDGDLLDFIKQHGPVSSYNLLRRIREGRICRTALRFNHQSLKPGIRMALSTIARYGAAKKMFEQELTRRLEQHYKIPVLIDLSVARGVPKSIRIIKGNDEHFLYDESALANGLVRSISRQISLCIFSNKGKAELEMDVSEILKKIEELSPDLLRYIRNEKYLNIEGVMLIFYCLHTLFSQKDSLKVLIPRIRNISCMYQLVEGFTKNKRLENLLDYKFHDRYGFPYSDSLFEDIQKLVAMGLVDEDLRYYDKNGHWAQRYEYVLTAEGVEYGENIAKYYHREMQQITEYLTRHKHGIPRDMVSIHNIRYYR